MICRPRAKLRFYNTTAKPKQTFTKEENNNWEESILEAITEDASVVDFYTFQKPLAGRALKCVRNCKLPGENHYLQHQYFVMKLKKKDREECFLSLDKAPDGITAQYGLSYESVVDKFKGKVRYQPLCDLERSFNPFSFLILPNVSTVLKGLENIVTYRVLTNNCQRLTQELADRLNKSDKIELHVPGTDKKVGLDDPSLVRLVESMYPNWRERNGDENLLYELTRIPKFGEIAIHSDDPGMIATVEDEQTSVLVEDSGGQRDYDDSVVRLKFYNRVCNNKKVMGPEGLFKNERHVIMHSLEPNKYTKVMEALKEEATAEALKEENPAEIKKGITVADNSNKMYAIEMVSGIWKQVFDILVITEKHGVILFQFADEGLGRDDKEEIKLKAEMLQKLGDFGESKFLTTILVNMHACKNKNPNFKKTSYGCHFDLTVSVAKREDEELASGDTIDESIVTVFTKIRKKIPNTIKKKGLGNKMNMLVGNIYLLQNMEDEYHLLHHKVTSQEWVRPGVMLWTPKQWECIELVKNYFTPEKSEKLRLVVKGCPGSGKTLLLMRIAREFVTTNKQKKVLLFIRSEHKMLIKSLTDIIAKDTILNGRVIISNRKEWDNDTKCSEKGSIGLFLEDEAIHDHEMKGNLSTQFHSVLFTSLIMLLKKGSPDPTRVIKLDGNLRSSNSICNKTLEFQKVLKGKSDFLPPVIDITPKLKLENLSEPVVHIFQDGSINREELLKNVLKIIDQTREKVGEKEDIIVSLICSPYLENKILSECERSGVYFHSPEEMLGCQFPIVILVWEPYPSQDPSTQFITSRMDIINVMTRCITDLTIIINNPYSKTIHGIPSFVHYSAPDIASFTKCLKEIDDEKILVVYKSEEIDPERYGEDAEHVRDFKRVIDESHKFTSQVAGVISEDEVRRLTSEYQLVVYVCMRYTADCSWVDAEKMHNYNISWYSPVPVIRVFITPRNGEHPMMDEIDIIKTLLVKINELSTM